MLYFVEYKMSDSGKSHPNNTGAIEVAFYVSLH